MPVFIDILITRKDTATNTPKYGRLGGLGGNLFSLFWGEKIRDGVTDGVTTHPLFYSD